MEDSKEFYHVIIVSGVFLGTLLIIGLTFSGVAIYKHLKKRNLIKEIYGEKERKNGQSKGGSRGKW